MLNKETDKKLTFLIDDDEVFMGVQKFPKKEKTREWNPEPKDKKRIKKKDFTAQRKAKRQELE